MKGLVTLDYQSLAITASRDAWFNATEIAELFNKRLTKFWEREETREYLDALTDFKYPGNGVIKKAFSLKNYPTLIKTKRGRHHSGTWLHPDLMVFFARWLDVRFSIWCDQQIKALLIEAPQWQRERQEVAICTKLQNEALKIALEAQGKTPQPHHYINEARLINSFITGEYAALEREQLSGQRLKTLRTLTIANMMGILQGQSYQTRKQTIMGRLEAIA